jgi:hypothetical protein
MSKKLTVMELPLYRDYFEVYKEIMEKLEYLIQKNSKHSLLLKETYKTTIQIFPYLTAGYNYFGVKGKVKLYNKVRMLLSQLQSQIHILFELKLFEKEYFEELENSIKYIGGLIKKVEGLPNES